MLGNAICSADDYFMHDGKYIYDVEKARDAHMWCQRKCRKFMQISAERIIISNTNISEKQFQPYVEMANEFGYRIFSIIVENRHGSSSIHDVPEAIIKRMEYYFEIKIWKQKIMLSNSLMRRILRIKNRLFKFFT